MAYTQSVKKDWENFKVPDGWVQRFYIGRLDSTLPASNQIGLLEFTYTKNFSIAPVKFLVLRRNENQESLDQKEKFATTRVEILQLNSFVFDNHTYLIRGALTAETEEVAELAYELNSFIAKNTPSESSTITITNLINPSCQLGQNFFEAESDHEQRYFEQEALLGYGMNTSEHSCFKF